MRFTAFDAEGANWRALLLLGGRRLRRQRRGGGRRHRHKVIAPDTTVLPALHSGAELLQRTRELGCSIAERDAPQRSHWRSDAEIDAGLLRIWRVMQDCVERGCATDGTLPGGFKVKRRAKAACARP
jgi:L-serine dehydratase